MTHKQLSAVLEIDGQIEDLQRTLGGLYTRRLRLLSEQVTTETAVTQPTPVTAGALYDEIQTAWKQSQLPMPLQAEVLPLLERAAARINQLQLKQPNHARNSTPILIPPSDQLLRLLSQSRLKLKFAEDTFHALTHTDSWSVVFVLNRFFNIPIKSYRAWSLSATENGLHEADTGLGIAELIAAELQGCRVTHRNEWTILAKDSRNSGEVICATRKNDTIIVDVDDSDCLLGDNYITYAIGVTNER